MITITVIILTILIIKQIRRKKAHENLFNKLCNIAGADNVKLVIKNKAFNFEMFYNERIYLVKLIYHPSKAEINVNNKLYWQINKGVVSSRKTGEKMEKVYDLILFDLEKNNFPLNTIKLYVIYPNSVTLLKVLNECEMEFISPKTNIYGCRMLRYTDLEEKISEI